MRERFPGDCERGLLNGPPEERAAYFRSVSDVPCPALEPESHACGFYELRPVACRAAGPPVSFARHPLPHCGLCYDGATEAEIEAARVDIDPESYEVSLLAEVGLNQTLIAFAIARAGEPK